MTSPSHVHPISASSVVRTATFVILGAGGALVSTITPVRAQDLQGKVMTVLGPVDPDSLGFTLSHQQLFVE